jgi:hypothetical protein
MRQEKKVGGDEVEEMEGGDEIEEIEGGEGKTVYLSSSLLTCTREKQPRCRLSR